jgi:hypothetical protein
VKCHCSVEGFSRCSTRTKDSVTHKPARHIAKPLSRYHLFPENSLSIFQGGDISPRGFIAFEIHTWARGMPFPRRSIINLWAINFPPPLLPLFC